MADVTPDPATAPEARSILDNATLIRTFVTPNLLVYFARKFPGLDQAALELRLSELLKFLILVRDFPGNIIFGKEIDEFWHFWIMQTREYEVLCAQLPGGDIRHHAARDYPEQPLSWEEARAIIATELTEGRDAALPHENKDGAKERFEQNAQRLLSFFASYQATFGPVAAEAVPLWPPLERLLARLNWSVERFNAFLEEQRTKSAA